jgi:alanyl-tRNA synthetase
MVSMEELRNLADTLRQKHKPAVVYLVNKQGKKLQTVFAITKEIADKEKLNAGKLINEIGKEIGGGGGTKVEGIERAVERLRTVLGELT